MDFDPSPHADPPRFGPAPSDPDTPDSSTPLPPRAKLPPVAPPLAGFITPATVPVAEPADDEPSPPPPLPPRGRRVALPICLFVATCFSTFWVGTAMFSDDLMRMLVPTFLVDMADRELVVAAISAHWREGLTYMLAVIGILLAHEMGHFLQAVRYRIPASFPFFIPMPISPIGTMGAVIAMRGMEADRKQLFDIGLSGPWAGLLLAIPITWIGVLTAEAIPLGMGGDLQFQTPLGLKILMWWLRPDLPWDPDVALNPLLFAGWVGMLITGLNMLPISQLDGGHVAYSIFGRHSHWLARGVAVTAVVFIVVAQQYGWILMLSLVFLIGVKHPPTANDNVPLGWPRIVIGTMSLIIPVLCLAPIPIS
jgi:Zn-dependent protease